MPNVHSFSAEQLTLGEALTWMTGLAAWLDEQEQPLRFKDDADSFMDPKQTARVLRALTQPAQGAA